MLHIQGGRYRDLAGGIVLGSGSRLTIADCLIESRGMLLESEGSVIDIERTRLRYAGAESIPSAMHVRGGSLSLRRSQLRAGAARVACTVERVGPMTVRDVRLLGAATGLRVFNSALPEVIGLEIAASTVGITWEGPWDRVWSWRAQRIEAPLPLRGESLRGLPVDGAGADPVIDRLMPPP